jgi:hypothetical protein
MGQYHNQNNGKALAENVSRVNSMVPQGEMSENIGMDLGSSTLAMFNGFGLGILN